MVAERVTPSPGDAPPGSDSAFNESGVRSPGSMAPDSLNVRSPDPGIYCPDMHISVCTPDSGLIASADSGLRDQEYRSPD